MFADDTKIFKMIASRNDAIILQSDMHKLEYWSRTWGLDFNSDKCHVLTMGKFEDIKHTHLYTVYNQEMEHVFEVKDLGVTFDAELTFTEHIMTKARKANAIVGLTRRSFTYLDSKSFTNLYTLLKHVEILEKVQMRATKLVDGFGNLDYPERLKRLNLPTLVYRRKRGDVIELYKHFHKYDKAMLSDSFQPRERCSRKHDFQLHTRKPKDGTRGVQSNELYYRSPNCGTTYPNTLSTRIISTNSKSVWIKHGRTNRSNSITRRDVRAIQRDLRGLRIRNL